MKTVLPGMVKISDLGVNLAEVRKQAKLSKNTMALKCGVSELTYYRWEVGTTQTMKQENFEKLEAAVRECIEIAKNKKES